MIREINKISRDLEALLKERMSNNRKLAASCIIIGILIGVFVFGHLKVMPGTIAGSIILIITLIAPLLFGYIGLFVAFVCSVLAVADPLNIWIRHDNPFFLRELILTATNFFASTIIAVVVEHNWKTQQLLKKLSITDGLTELYNFRYFKQRLDQEMSRAVRSQKPLALCIIDIDYFKQYNDSYGHYSGDEVLKKTAQLLNSTLRKSDIVFRYGGDEFLVIMPDINAHEASGVMERLRKAFSNHEFRFSEANSNECLTLSIGISSFPDLSCDMDELIAQADKALYHVKRKGRNKVESYETVN
ncbi:GGDEF domain-containing protein [Dehalobacter sp. DCM]|uniref:GGDEF domain-containing protein n=1 Tax=Dehalobacter sp. DCM TaxID=2907827 RepID=UPI0030821414|nr:GGDEF domain-containing protein [Dehalobacter sp. DCM]